MLQEAAPDRPVEIVNLGIVALASRQVKLIVADTCRRYEPDVLIVYSGNNEFLELHAEKFAALRRGVLDGVLGWLRDTNLRRLADRVVLGPPTDPALDLQDFASDQQRLTEARIIQDVDITAAEVDAIIDAYEGNLDDMAQSAQASGTNLVLMTVASNWKWRGRSDLADAWLAEVLGEDAPEGPAAYRRAIAALTERLATTPARERWELLFRRAVAAEDWLGFSFEKALLWDRGLWKYERMRKGLDGRLARDPRDVRALVYRGNAHFFDLRGAAAAERDYRNALAVAPERSEIRANLDRLFAQGRL